MIIDLNFVGPMRFSGMLTLGGIDTGRRTGDEDVHKLRMP